VLLVKAVIKWRAERGGLPSSSRERASFKQLLKSWQRNIDGVPIDVRTLLFLLSFRTLSFQWLHHHCDMHSALRCRRFAAACISRWLWPYLLRLSLENAAEPGCWRMQEENFNEAINNAHKMWSPPGIRECTHAPHLRVWLNFQTVHLSEPYEQIIAAVLDLIVV